jgi:hypothetical protein
MVNWDDRENWCLSGGADGADLMWGQAAKLAGHGLIHFSFDGAHSVAMKADVVRLSPAMLAAADPFCVQANATLHRQYPPRSKYVRRLLQRNWYQVESSESLYAISRIANGQVAGGTAWAVEMFLNINKRAACPAYVFDQEDCRWYQWNGAWETIYEPPRPRGIWTGIGSRKINVLGRLAIGASLDYWPGRMTIWP